jgi:hypothetical protein
VEGGETAPRQLETTFVALLEEALLFGMLLPTDKTTR